MMEPLPPLPSNQIYHILNSDRLSSPVPFTFMVFKSLSIGCSYTSTRCAVYSQDMCFSFPRRWCLHLAPECTAVMALALETVTTWEHLLPLDPNIPLTGLMVPPLKRLATSPFPLFIQTAFLILITSARLKEEIKALVAEFHVWRKVS